MHLEDAVETIQVCTPRKSSGCICFQSAARYLPAVAARACRPFADAPPFDMSTLTAATAITDKTRELCQTILDHPAFLSAQQRIRAFMADDQARSAYEAVVGKGEALRHKQHHGESVADAERVAFERERVSLLCNPVAAAFIDAQSELHEVRKSVEQHIALTLELGRLPTDEDFSGGCGCDSG